MRLLRLSCVLAVLISNAIIVDAAERPQQYEPQYHRVSLDYQTPHTKWAQPLAAGEMSALLIAPRACMRDVAEIAQRVELDFEVVAAYLSQSLNAYLGKSHTNILGFSPDDKNRELMKKLRRRYDLIVVGNLHWKVLPVEGQYEILSKVRDGTGLILSYYTEGQNEYLKRFLDKAQKVDDDGAIGDGIPFRALPAWQACKSHAEAAEAAYECRRFGKGRVVLLNFSKRTNNVFLVPPTADAEMHHIDYYFSLTAKAFVWAARRESQMRLQSFCLRDPTGERVEEIDRSALQECRIEVKLSESDRKVRGHVWMRLRDDNGQEIMQRTDSPTDGVVSFSPPPLPAGRYYVDAIATRLRHVENWWSTFFTVTCKQGIAELKTDKPTAAPGDKVKLSIALVEAAAPDTITLVSAVDCLGRLFYQAEIPVPKGEKNATAVIPFPNPVSNLSSIEAQIRVGDEIICRANIEQPINLKLPRDDFGFLVWLGESNEYPWRFVRKILYEHGVDTSNVGKGPILARSNIHPCSYVTRIAPTDDTAQDIRVPCLSSPKYREAQRERLTSAAEISRLYGPTGYSLGDENFLSRGPEYCFSPTCKGYFRTYLKEIYGNLDTLNQEWETNYSRWEDVEPIKLSEALSAEREGALAQWADHRMCMESLYADIHAFMRDAIRSVDPGARVGDEGSFSTNSYAGYDWWKLSKVMDVWNIYPTQRHTVEMIRSFGRPHTYSGSWYGGYTMWSRWESRERWIPWFTVLHRMTAAWWFKAYSSARETCQEDAIAADLTIFPCFLWSVEEITDIKHGFGKLLLNCQRDNCGIAVLYSQASVHAATIDNTYGRADQAMMGALHLIEDLGLQYDFISYEQLAQGVLNKNGYRVIVLPAAMALSNQEKTVLMQFVEAGGCLIADIRPGVRDGHSKSTHDETWFDFLGVRFGESKVEAVEELEVEGTEDDLPVKVKLSQVSVDVGARAQGATALGTSGEFCAMLSRTHGSGHILLLNTPLSRYKPEADAVAGIRAVVSALLEKSHVRPLVTVHAHPGPLFQGEVITYTDGKARYVALLRDESLDTPVQRLEVELPDGFEVYDSRRRRHLGKKDKVRVKLEEGRTAVFALLPYQVHRLKAEVPNEVRQGDNAQVTIKLSAKEAKPGRHVVRLDVYGPDEKALQHYGQNIELKDGLAVATIPFALNDSVGEYRITVRDIATGEEDSKELRMLPEK